ncbi:MAG: NADH-quinone oxidoreductase subunit J [Candidatus Nitrosocaldus sp.]
MSDPYFITVSVITIASAIIALEFKELIYGAIALAVTLLGIAMFFVLLDATFVAMFQITVYVGAVVVLIIFTIMLVRREAWLRLDEGGRRRVMGTVIALAVIGLLGALLASSSIARWQASESTPTLMQIGEEMLTYYSPAFIALAFTLAASVVGALILAKVERGKEKGKGEDDEEEREESSSEMSIGERREAGLEEGERKGEKG